MTTPTTTETVIDDMVNDRPPRPLPELIRAQAAGDLEPLVAVMEVARSFNRQMDEITKAGRRDFAEMSARGGTIKFRRPNRFTVSGQ